MQLLLRGLTIKYKIMTFKIVIFFIALSFVCCTINAQIVYTDINPDSTTLVYSQQPPGEAENVAPIDFNGDNTEEYDFSWDYLGANGWNVNMDYQNNELNLSGAPPNPWDHMYLDPMTSGTAINSSSNWGNSSLNPLIADIYSANFQGVGERYVGCKFTLGTNTHYGWVRVSFDTELTLIVKDYAYESTPNTPINAGDKGVSSVDDISFDTYFNIYPIPTSTRLTIETIKEAKIKSVRIINLSGQISYSTNEILLNTINIPESLQGLYFLQIETAENKVLNKKIILE